MHWPRPACSADNSQASIFAHGSVNRTRALPIRVDVSPGDHGRGGASDRIRLGNGYDSTRQPLTLGKIRIGTGSRNHHDR